MTPIRVMLVDDSPLVLAVLTKMLAAAPDIRVVAALGSGREALERIPLDQPDVICTDLHMPDIDGLELTRRVMAECPRPILVISVSVDPLSDGHNIFRLLEAGAVDVYAKPRLDSAADNARIGRELAERIRILAGVVVIRRYGRQTPLSKPCDRAFRQRAPRIVAVGASTGGPLALQAIFGRLPSDFALPIVCIQHICRDFLQSLLDWLAPYCPMKLKIMRHGEAPQAGTIYFPQEDTHLEIDPHGRLMCSHRPAYQGHRPSITVTFRSLAQHYGRDVLGILLTGMGKDGAEGLREIAHAGGMTVAQDEKSCVVFGMPAEAVRLGAVEHLLPLREIAPLLSDITNTRPHASP